MVAQVDFEVCKRAFERLEVNLDARRNVDVQEVCVEFTVGKDRQILVCVFLYVCESVVEIIDIVDVAERYRTAQSERQIQTVVDIAIGVGNKEFCRETEAFFALSAVVFIFEFRIIERNFCACVVTREYKTEDHIEDVLRKCHGNTFDVENISVHIHFDLFHDSGNEAHRVYAVGCESVVFDNDVRLVEELSIACASRCIAVDSVFDSVEKFVDKAVEKFVDVDVVHSELRAVFTEHTACVYINAFERAVIVRAESLLAVKTANFRQNLGFFGVLGVDLALQRDGKFYLLIVDNDVFRKQLGKRSHHFRRYVFGDYI